MSDCERFEEAIRARAAGEPTSGDAAASLSRHAERCPACHALLTLDRALLELGARHEPEPAALAAMRADVLRDIARSAARGSAPGPRVRRGPYSLPAWAAAAAAVPVFLLGFAAAQVAFERQAPAGKRLLHEITAEAAGNRSLGDVEDSPFTYSEVRFRRLDDGRVALDFDVTRHVSVVEPARSDLVQEVLAQSLLNPSPTGSRLKAISLAANVMAPKVRDALIFALRHDTSLAVRRKALAILTEEGAGDPQIEAAVLTTLREDESVQVRLEALDYLAARPLDREAIRQAITDTADPGAAALMARLERYDDNSSRR
jgi:hypothetical protein